MGRNVTKPRADVPRARRGYIRAAALSLPLALFVTLALVPFSVNYDSGVNFEKHEAYANPAVVTGAAGFIDAAASAAGLSSADFVATIAGVTASGVGMNIASSAGVSLGSSFSHNINALLDAGDYMPWENLSQQDQESWQSQENYNSAKFNQLMDAFDLGDARDRFYSSGGADFESDELAIIEKLGLIGNNWLQRGSNAYSDILSTIKDKEAVSQYLGARDYSLFDASSIQGWPSSIPTQVYVNKVSNYKYASVGLGTFVSNEVNCVSFEVDNGTQIAYLFDLTSFRYKTYGSVSNPPTGDGLNKTSKTGTYDGNNYYYYDDWPGYKLEGLQTSGTLAEGNVRTFLQCIPLILFSPSFEEPGAPTVPDYPSGNDIPNDTPVYYPEEVTPVTTWQDYLTEPEVPPEPIVRPENPYNPNDQTGTQEWRDETTDNVMPLQNIKFHKLFPFCLMTDVKDLTEKIEDTITPGEQSDYLKIKIPMAYASDGEGGSVSEDIELDGTPLRDLLVMARPFNQLLLLFLMVFSLVMFWKSILTGD